MVFDELESWLKNNGVDTSQLFINSTNPSHTERGVFLRNKPHSDVLLSIPLKLIISSKSIDTSMIIPHFNSFRKAIERNALNFVKDLTPRISLIISILLAKNGLIGNLKPYLDVLPNQLHLTSLWDTSELLLLGDSELQRSTIPKIKHLKSEYSEIKQYFFSLLGEIEITLEDYFWADAVVRSRTLENKNCWIMVPFLDMLNHSNTPNTTWEINNDVLTLVSKSSRLDSDSELFISYGEKSNTELLYSYGFIISANPYDKVRLLLPLDFDSDEIMFSKRLSLFHKYGLPVIHLVSSCSSAYEIQSSFSNDEELLVSCVCVLDEDICREVFAGLNWENLELVLIGRKVLESQFASLIKFRITAMINCLIKTMLDSFIVDFPDTPRGKLAKSYVYETSTLLGNVSNHFEKLQESYMDDEIVRIYLDG